MTRGLNGEEMIRVGDLVQVNGLKVLEDLQECAMGVVIRDHSPMRPPDVGRIVDVLWSSGEIEDVYSSEIEVISENRK